MATSNETATYIGDLPANPTVPTDPTAGGRSRGGAEIRKTKKIMRDTFAGFTGAVVNVTEAQLNLLVGLTATAAELNKLDALATTAVELGYVAGVTSAIQTQLDAKIGSAGVTFENLNTNGDVGSGAAQVAQGSHSHELEALDATGETSGHVLTADGAGGAAFLPPSNSATFVEFENTTGNISTSTSASSAIASQTVTIPTRGTIALRSAAFRWLNSGASTRTLGFGLRVGANLYPFYSNFDASGFTRATSSGTTTSTGAPSSGAVGKSMCLPAIDIESAGFVTNGDTGSQTLELYAIQDGETGTLQNTTVDFRALIEIIDMS